VCEQQNSVALRRFQPENSLSSLTYLQDSLMSLRVCAVDNISPENLTLLGSLVLR